MPNPRDSLAAILESSGLTISACARDVLGRDVRTVRRWLNGDVAIPDSAAQWIERATVARTRSGVRITVASSVTPRSHSL